MTVAEALRDATVALAAAGVEGAARDARLLMAAALGCDSDRLTLRACETVPAAAAARLGAMVSDRAGRRPVSQILGRRRFWGRDFAVTADVLDPRPETETLIAAALAGPAPARVLDLGTGSGAILLTLLAEWPDAVGTGTDASAAALGVAARNAEALGIAGRARLVRADWAEGVRERFDLVVCNPPYIPAGEIEALAPEVRRFEPRMALTPGEGGLEAYGRIAPELPRLLAPGGRALFEFGAGQEATVAAVFRALGFAPGELHDDLDGRPRVIELRRA
jgi:release factor glutamine methyltransferase